MLERDSLKIKATRSNSLNDRKPYKMFRNRVTNISREQKQIYFKRKIKDVSKNPKATWSTINYILGRKSQDHVINNIKLHGSTLTSADLMAESFNDFYEHRS